MVYVTCRRTEQKTSIIRSVVPIRKRKRLDLVSEYDS